MQEERHRLSSYEKLVLTAILHNDGNADGVTTRREVEKISGRSTSVGAIYTALDRVQT